MTVSLGPIDLPSWAIIAGFLGGGFFLIQQGMLPAVYDLVGVDIPLQDIAVVGVLLVLGIAVYRQVDDVI